MERKINTELTRWYNDRNRKPMLLYGPKQVGKTYTALKFAKNQYKTLAYINADNNEELLSIVKTEKNAERLIMKLSVLVGETILKNDTLIVIDNLNNIDIVNLIKRLSIDLSDYHIIMITSYKENLLKYKGDELNLKYMYGMDFEEFLKALNQEQLIDFIKQSFKNNNPMPFHAIALEYFEQYLILGDNPDTIAKYILDKDLKLINIEHKRTLEVLKNELFLVDNLIDMPRGVEVFNILPYQLLKENKKFQYTLIKDGARSKEYETVIDFLANNNLVNRAYKISNVTTPLSKARDKDSFKLYPNNTGLLYYLLHLNYMKYLTNDEYRKLLIENNIANNIVAGGYNLYYYQSEGKAEVSFIVQTRNGQTIPIDIVTKDEAKSKSLVLFMKKFNTKVAIRITEDNFSVKGNIKYIPTYASFCLKDSL